MNQIQKAFKDSLDEGLSLDIDGEFFRTFNEDFTFDNDDKDDYVVNTNFEFMDGEIELVITQQEWNDIQIAEDGIGFQLGAYHFTFYKLVPMKILPVVTMNA